VATLSTNIGPDGGGNTIVMTGGVAFAGPLVPGTGLFIQFQPKATATTTCASGYTAGAAVPGAVIVPSASITATATTATFVVPAAVSILAGQTSSYYNVCAYPDTSTTAFISATAAADNTTAYQVVPRLTLSSQNGPTAGGNTLTMTAPAGSSPFDSTFGIQFQASTPATNPTSYCSATWLATVPVVAATPAGVVPVNAATIGVVTADKIVVPVPATIGNGGALGFHVCVYESIPADPSTADTGSHLVMGSGLPYTVGAPATITSVTPSAGPAQGGSTITVVGTGFAAGMTVSLAGVQLTPTNITSSGFQAVMPPRAAGGPFKLSVTTAAGTTTTAAGVYSYSNGIQIQPNTATNTKTAKTWMSIKGVGFGEFVIPTSSTNGATPNGSGPHVYLVKGVYDPKGTAGVKANGQSAECVDVLVISDTEMICGLYLAGNNTAHPVSRSFAGCAAAALAATSLTPTTNSPTCVFTANDVGMTITSDSAGSIAANTVITAVNPTTGAATLSKPLTAAIVVTTPTFTVSSARSVTTSGIATTNTLSSTAATGPFTASDVGRRVSGANIPANTTITAVSGSGVATLSATPTGTSASGEVVTLTTPVPIGTYTLTVVNSGALNAATDPAYTQSIISSGSTFTVADY
jgi:hypothetical protein